METVRGRESMAAWEYCYYIQHLLKAERRRIRHSRRHCIDERRGGMVMRGTHGCAAADGLSQPLPEENFADAIAVSHRTPELDPVKWRGGWLAGRLAGGRAAVDRQPSGEDRPGPAVQLSATTLKRAGRPSPSQPRAGKRVRGIIAPAIKRDVPWGLVHPLKTWMDDKVTWFFHSFNILSKDWICLVLLSTKG